MKLLRGNPGHRPIPKKLLKPAPGADCPRELSDEARKEWNRLAPELLRLGVLTMVDRAALAAYCEAYADFVWALDTLEKEGRTAVTDKGYVHPHPAVTIKRQSMEAMRQFAAEFGFTPAARGRVAFPGTDGEKSDNDRFFGPQPIAAPPPAPRAPKRRA